MQQAANTFANVTAETIFDAFGELLPQVDRDAMQHQLGGKHDQNQIAAREETDHPQDEQNRSDNQLAFQAHSQ